ncbi:MAG TPA: hypothetical protein VN969_36040 [Streptosporangiaceae bacterium]|jgi:hypothetical protein|nr:hypothetical protein [Streptosporangiaceae bacterium]
MFDKRVPAEAQVLADEGSGSVVERDTHGVPWDHRKFILEVRPVGQAAFRVEVKAKVPSLHAPQVGELVKVSCDLKNHKTEIEIKGDPRYDPQLRRANAKQQRAAEAQALLSGAPAAPSVVRELVDDDGPVPEDY